MESVCDNPESRAATAARGCIGFAGILTALIAAYVSVRCAQGAKEPAGARRALGVVLGFIVLWVLAIAV